MNRIASRKPGRFGPLWLLALAIAVVLGANAHLIYVATATQPQCVAHLKDKGERPGEFRAARSEC
jgi:hypothetical protein